MTLATVAFGITACLIADCWESKKLFLRNYRTPNWWEAHIDCTMDYARNSSEGNDVVFLGDSACITGLETRRFGELTGLSAYNLGCGGLIGIDGFSLILESYLEHHPVPRMVVFCVHPETLCFPASKFGLTEVRDRYFWCYGQAGRPAKETLSEVRQGTWIAFGQLRGGLTRYATEPIDDFFLTMDLNTYRQSLIEQRGYLAKRGSFMKDLPRVRAPEEGFVVLPACSREIGNFARFSQQRGIALMIRYTPVLACEAGDFLNSLRLWEDEFSRAYPAVLVDRPEVLPYDSSHFRDEMHCNPHGAEKFTAFVAEKVTAALAGR
jgi:hypothetical protein